MGTPAWLARRRADVPPGEDWLSERERRVLAGMRFERRRSDWRLGRWAAKSALAAALEVPVGRIEVLAAEDGAPEAWLDGLHAPVSLSISHREGRALAVVASSPICVGCDLEVVEPRSDAFVREWLSPEEQRRLRGTGSDRQRDLLANLLWTGKEAAAKVRREGLRLDVRSLVVTVSYGSVDGWHPLRVEWDDGQERMRGWWRSDPGWVMAVACEPALPPPRALEGMRVSAVGVDGARGVV
jgi:4'-phosphopantetheinyl transferase